MMATNNNRKKLDEYHLKVLRELLTQPANKYCFDCQQRGPTYVNVTIGTFVCTKCSGMLRGLTPPHRVKSVSMATFLPEEVDFVKSRGNEYCRRVWLGLYNSEIEAFSEDQQVKDFMISKYEKKRYYIEPSTVQLINGSRTPSSLSSASSSPCSAHNSPSSSSGFSDGSSTHSYNSKSNQFAIRRPTSLHTSVNNTQLLAGSPSSTTSDLFDCSYDSASSSSETSFANFDNNPAFSATPATSCSQSSAFANGNGISAGPLTQQGHETPLVPQVEDKYAALKDLDYMMKMQMFEKQLQAQQTQMYNGLKAQNFGFSQSNGWPKDVSSEPATPFNPFMSTNVWNGNANIVNGFHPNLVGSTHQTSFSNNGNASDSLSQYNGGMQPQSGAMTNGWGAAIQTSPNPFGTLDWSQASKPTNPFL